jgi:DNA repair exonuclease SbcCD ATPase subunit
MESPKATTILNEILQKLSKLTKEDELAQGIKEEVVAENLSEQVKEDNQEAKQELSEEVKQEASEESELSEESTEVEAEETQLMEGYVKQEEFESKISSLESKMAELMKKVDEDLGVAYKDKKMMSEQIEKLSAEPAAETIKHSPETEVNKANVSFRNPNRPISTLDRVLERISK